MNGKSASGPKKVHEAMDLYASLPYFPYLDSRDLFAEAGPYGFMDGVPQQYLTRRDNRMAGELLPLYINWWQLKIIRDRSRQICRNNEFAIAAINAHRNYVVGTGFQYSVQARVDSANNELISRTQDLVDLFIEHNRMPELESEVIYRLHSDGECFLRSFKGEDGLLRIRFIEPELVRPPADDTTPASSFGIKCADEDIHHVVGYWVIEKPWENLTPTLVPADQILHLKINSESNSKRGLPTVYAVESNLRAAEDVLQSMIAVAKARSKIAVIRKVNDSPPEAISALTQTAADYTVTDPVQNRATTINHMGYGSILTSTGNVEYDFPAMNIGAADLVETLSANLRAIAARFGITETMMSTDASNNNYASALVAEAPAVKTFERMQRLIGQSVGERRTRPERSLIWQQISHAVNIGMLPRDVLDQVVIRAKGPQLIARDYDREAQTAKTYMDMGLWSPQTITAESGKNFEEEQRNIAKAKEEMASRDFELSQKYKKTDGEQQTELPESIQEIEYATEALTPDELAQFNAILAKMPKRSSAAQKEKAAQKRAIDRLKKSGDQFRSIIKNAERMIANAPKGVEPTEARSILANAKSNLAGIETELKKLQAKETQEASDKLSEKIKLLMDEGYEQKQAVAIALSMQRRGEL
jgi:capsid protein